MKILADFQKGTPVAFVAEGNERGIRYSDSEDRGAYCEGSSRTRFFSCSLHRLERPRVYSISSKRCRLVSNLHRRSFLQSYLPVLCTRSASSHSLSTHFSHESEIRLLPSALLKVFLKDWWLVKAEKEFEGKRLAVARITTKEKQALRVFSSAPIPKRYDVFNLETVNGICVIIEGFMNKARTEENGFPSERCLVPTMMLQRSLVLRKFWRSSLKSINPKLFCISIQRPELKSCQFPITMRTKYSALFFGHHHVKSMISAGLATIACNYDLESAILGKKTLNVLCIGHGGGSIPLFLASILFLVSVYVLFSQRA